MKKIKIAHEAPLSLMRDVRAVTDYDYALVHLFEDEKIGGEYFDFFKDSLRMGREVILDNSVFELEEHFDVKKYVSWVNRLKPTYCIAPDVLDDYLATMNSTRLFLEEERVDDRVKIMGSVQGTTYQEFMTCFEFMNNEPGIDVIAITFNAKVYESLCPHQNKLYSWMYGRQFILKCISENYSYVKPIHLLGCSLPQEFKEYRYLNLPIISMDSFNPVIHGLHKKRYESYGLDSKISTKVIDLLNSNASSSQFSIIMENINRFKEFCNE